MWLARDRNGELYVYISKPHKADGNYWSNNGNCWHISDTDNDFSNVKWSDEEPTEVKLQTVKKQG